jgi:predicted membrane-bound dolichyl-phosphate-mannose-protein mannosyltransferase
MLNFRFLAVLATTAALPMMRADPCVLVRICIACLDVHRSYADAMKIIVRSAASSDPNP